MSNNTGYLYNRKISLLIGYSGGEGIDLSDFRISFNVSKNSHSAPNEFTITIYNLAEDLQNQLAESDMQIILKAGYEGLVSTIAVGNIIKCEHIYESPNIITTLQCSDSGSILNKLYFAKSYSKGTQIANIINDILDASTLDVGILSPLTLAKSTRGAVHLKGSIRQCLDQLAKSYKFRWSAQNQIVNVLEPDEMKNTKATCISLSGETGLIECPRKVSIMSTSKSDVVKKVKQKETVAKGKKAKQVVKHQGYEIKSLLMPSVIPTDMIYVKHRIFTGYLKVVSMEHTGDNFDSDFNTTFQGITI